jgi:hypothetical protein
MVTYLHMCRLVRIIGKIMTRLYSIRRVASMQSRDIIVAEIAEELQEWMMETPAFFQPEKQAENWEELPFYHVAWIFQRYVLSPVSQRLSLIGTGNRRLSELYSTIPTCCYTEDTFSKRFYRKQIYGLQSMRLRLCSLWRRPGSVSIRH